MYLGNPGALNYWEQIKKNKDDIAFIKANMKDQFAIGADYDPNVTTYNISDILLGPDDVINTGDLVIFNNCYAGLIDAVGEYTITIINAYDFKGPQGDQGNQGDPGTPGAAAGFGTVTASVDSNVGTPAVTVTTSGPDTAKVFDFAFENLKGADGTNGTNGAAAGFGTVTASVDSNVGTPAVTVTTSGPDTAKEFNFAFSNLKGQAGTVSTIQTDTITGVSDLWTAMQNNCLLKDGALPSSTANQRNCIIINTTAYGSKTLSGESVVITQFVMPKYSNIYNYTNYAETNFGFKGSSGTGFIITRNDFDNKKCIPCQFKISYVSGSGITIAIYFYNEGTNGSTSITIPASDTTITATRYYLGM